MPKEDNKMIQPEIGGHIREADHVIMKWFCPIFAAILFFFSAFAIATAFKYPEDIVSGIIVPVMMLGIGMFLLVIRYRVKSLNMTYHCDRNSIENSCFGRTQSIDLNVSFFISDLPVKDGRNRPVCYEHYFLLSSRPFSPIPNLGEGGRLEIDKLWKRGILILPSDDRVKVWLSSVTGISQIPQYPEAAYIQRDDFWRSYE